jgi:hypothetical protein
MPLLCPIVDRHEAVSSGSADAPDASLPLNVGNKGEQILLFSTKPLLFG